MGVVGKKQHTVKSSTLLEVLRDKSEETNGACATFGFNCGTDVNLLHTYMYLSLFVTCYSLY